MQYTHLQVIGIALLCGLVSVITAIFMNPLILKLAYKKHLTDVPNHRKLQKRPVPILGGMSVYLALINGLFICNFMYPTDNLYVVIAALSLIFFMGFFDDLLDLSVLFRFIVEFGVVFLLWTFGYRIDTFAGLFGITHIPMVWSCLLSMFAGVGLMNAFNLVDGVDGLASGLGLFTTTICGLYFITHHDPLFAMLSVVLVGSLMFFFICNVFSKKYKMYIGDSGSLILGLLAYVFSCRILQNPILDWNDQYRVSMLIAIYAIPVFDTLRVMFGRLTHGRSPFTADKTHLHHMLLNLHYPHIMVTAILLLINSIVIGIWYHTTFYIHSIDLQFFCTLITSILAIQALYFSLEQISIKFPQYFERMAQRAEKASSWPIKFRNQVRDLIDGNVKRRIRMRRAKHKAKKALEKEQK